MQYVVAKCLSKHADFSLKKEVSSYSSLSKSAVGQKQFSGYFKKNKYIALTSSLSCLFVDLLK